MVMSDGICFQQICEGWPLDAECLNCGNPFAFGHSFVHPHMGIHGNMCHGFQPLEVDEVHVDLHLQDLDEIDSILIDSKDVED